jgi:hypothetical protein
MKYLKLLLLLLITLISTSVLSFSAGKLEIRDTTIERGRVYNIPIYGIIPFTSAKTIKIELDFDAMVIDIKKAIGDVNFGLQSDLISNIDISNLKNAKIIISTSSFKNDFSGIICELAIEGLAGIDTTCYIVPVSMSLDNDTISDINLIKGKININSIPVEPKYLEGLGQNYPNPYFVSTTFPFTIDKETNVNFKLFSLSGKKLNEEADLNDIFQIVIYNENGNIVEKPDNFRFIRGSYKIVLTPFKWKLSSGTYFLIMKTDNGVYRMNFIYIK